MQGEDPDYSWAVMVMLFYLKLLLGVVSFALSVCWLVQVVLYMFTYPPINPFLNTLFITLDNVFPLFGVLAFALFCFYLVGGLLPAECRSQSETGASNLRRRYKGREPFFAVQCMACLQLSQLMVPYT